MALRNRQEEQEVCPAPLEVSEKVPAWGPLRTTRWKEQEEEGQVKEDGGGLQCGG